MNRMTQEEILVETARQWAKLRTAIDTNQVRWLRVPMPEDGIAFNGVCPACTVNVICANVKERGKMCIGMMTPLDSLFSIIKLSDEMAEYCFNAAQASQN